MKKDESKSESKKDLKFQLPKEDQSKLPEFPTKDVKDASEFPGGSEDEITDVDLEDICKDVIAVPFEVWHLLKPGVTPLTEKEKELISKPLARVAQKYDVQKYMKDEFLLLAFLGFSVSKRLREGKKEDKKERAETGKVDKI